MSCTCYKDITEKLTERFELQAPEATGHKVELQGYGFTIDANLGLQLRPFMPYHAGADYPLKKGGAGGMTRWKSKRGNMFFNFCPFCGDKLSKDPAALSPEAGREGEHG